MQHYLRWKEAEPLFDAYDTLLCGEENTYRFIDKMIGTMKKAFRSKRINVGLDEAFNMGKGVYIRKNGFVDFMDIFLAHIGEVLKICKKYGYETSIWSDMFFVLNSKTGRYNDYEVEITEELKKRIPDVTLNYWEYDKKDEEHYQIMLKKHLATGKKIEFSGSVYSFLDFVPSMKRTLDATVPAMNACLKLGIRDVIATLWGGDGAECPLFMTLAGLPAFTEYCYHGLECTEDDIKEIMEFVTGFDYEFTMLTSKYDNIMNRRNQGREILYGDPFWGPLGKSFDYEKAVRLYGEVIEELRKKSCAYEEFNELALLLFEIIQKKCPLFYLREPYCAGDKEKLRKSAEEVKELTELYKRLWSLHKKIWNKYCRIFGWEVHAARYATMTARLEYIGEQLSDYADGKTDKIDELEEKLEDAVSIVPLPIYNRLTFTPFPVV